MNSAKLRWNWERLGESTSLSQLVALLYLPFGLVGPLLIDRARLGGSALTWLAIALAGQAALMLCFAGFRSLIHRRTPDASHPIATVIAFFVSLVARGLVLSLLTVWAGFSSSYELSYRLGSAFVAQGGVLIVFALVVSAHQYHRKIAAELQRQREQIIELNESMRLRLSNIQRDLRIRVRQNIDPLVAELDVILERVALDENAPQVSAAIRSLVDDELRPLSHRLATVHDAPQELVTTGTPLELPRMQLPARVPMGNVIMPGAIGVLSALAAASQAVREWQLPGSVTFPVFTGLIVAVELLVIRLIVGRIVLPTGVVIGLNAVITGLAFGFSIGIQRAVGLPVPSFIWVAAFVVGMVFGLLASLYVAVNERRSATEEQLKDSKDELESMMSVLRQHAFIASRQLGYVIHGSVQGALHAAALRLTANPHPSAEEIVDIRRDISAAMAKLDSESSPYVRLVDTLDDIAELWDGTCTVHWTMDHKTVRLLVESPDAAASAAEIARECVTNAIKHGHAKDVWITIAKSGDRVVVTAVDDGVSTGGTWQPGLGAKMLDEMCVSWRHESTDDGTRVEAEIATHPASS